MWFEDDDQTKKLPTTKAGGIAGFEPFPVEEKPDELTTLRARVTELERDLAAEQERSEGWRDRAGAASQRVAELESRASAAEARVAELERDLKVERERSEGWCGAHAVASARAEAAEQRMAETEKALDAEKKQSAFYDLQAQRIMVQRDTAAAELNDAWKATEVAGTVRGLTGLADVVDTTRRSQQEALARVKRLEGALISCRNRTRSEDVAREIDAALAASEGATGATADRDGICLRCEGCHRWAFGTVACADFKPRETRQDAEAPALEGDHA